ncbi:glycosyltransferase [Methylocystis parvus]|uniref:glycosyltransferase n=1 Tax=Methylocystis parvus TaxID=134 RepID=UPI003C710888
MTKLCLSMIVKNEMANLERCLRSVADHIDYWVIGDTGSTDGTQDFIRSFFDQQNVPGELHSFPFVNFEQARNEGLRCAYDSKRAFDYILFTDADMELLVEDPNFRSRLEGPGYQLVQRTSSGLFYWNTRIVRRDVGAWYRGVTHEYVDVPGGSTQLSGLWYMDHACGSNRVDKFERDIRLLKQGLKDDPKNIRYHFYLAQSYRDAGKKKEAAEAYAKRIALGGWDEEVYVARLERARCLRDIQDESGFVKEELTAFNQRPTRAEPLYDLARYYRIKGWNDVSAMFAERGLEIPVPAEDVLFVEEWIYCFGLKEEYSIAANYARDPARKERGFVACEWLALNRDTPPGPAQLAYSNLQYYVLPLTAFAPSFSARRLASVSSDAQKAFTPSVAVRGDDAFVLQGVMNAEGSVRYFLSRYDRELQLQGAAEARIPEEAPLGREMADARLFALRGELHCTARRGSDKHVIARIDESGVEPFRLCDWRSLETGADHPSTVWIPQVAGETLGFISSCDPIRILDEQGRLVAETNPGIDARSFAGGAQAIEFDGGWLTLIHEAHEAPQALLRSRFVWLDADNELRAISRPFFFQERGAERVGGLAWAPDGSRLLISYSTTERDGWLASVDASEIRNALRSIDLILSGASMKRSQDGVARRREARSQSLARRPARAVTEAGASTADIIHSLAPYLKDADSVVDRVQSSRNFDAHITPYLKRRDLSALPPIHCFYEALSDSANHDSLIAATTSMVAAGHQVKVWTYTPDRLAFLRECGVQTAPAEDIVPRGLFERILGSSEIRYFSDIFRYAVLYEHGGLWMDTDVVLLRSFPFCGDYFFNLQWRAGAANEHFICGNVIYAKKYSPHIRALYEAAVSLAKEPHSGAFGDVGPKLLSDYVCSKEGAELRDWVFSPMFFNSIDWTETDRFDLSIMENSAFLNDERVFGVHLWNAKTNQHIREGRSLISQLTKPTEYFPSFTALADRFETDKNRRTGNAHFYARVFEGLLAGRRLSVKRIVEIGLCRGLPEGRQVEESSIGMWLRYFPFSHVIGVDAKGGAQFNHDRFMSLRCDASEAGQLRELVGTLGAASTDVIVDDGTHASLDQQTSLVELFPLLSPGGWYFIAALDWQPPGEDRRRVTPTKDLLREIQRYNSTKSVDPAGVGELSRDFEEILFFDSHYELARANLLGGLVAIRKRGGAGFVP